MPHAPPAATPISLEQLIALNDEIAALVRVGVPLESGLRELGADMPGWVGVAAQLLADGMDRGQSLPEAMAQNSQVFPPVYQAVVEAGLKSGRLAIALEAMSGASRRALDARRIVLAGMVYPLLVFLVAWSLFVLFVLKIGPAFAAAFPDLPVAARGVLSWIVGWGDSVGYWGPGVPIVMLLTGGAWAFLSARASTAEPRMASALLGWLPWSRRMLQSFRAAMFADVLALLIDNCVPLPKSLVLAARAVGSRRMIQAAEDMAASVERGEGFGAGAPAVGGFPPLLHWLMAGGQDRGTLVSGLRHMAEIYHERARRAGDSARLLVPVVLTVVVGGGVTAVYAVLVFGSWIAMLRALAGI